MKIKTSAIGCALALLAPLAATAADPAPASRVYTFEVTLDARGSVESARPAHAGHDPTYARITEELRSWAFQAGTLDGVPQPTTTWVRVLVDAGTAGQAARILSASAGPAPERLQHPVFPAAAQRRGHHGVVVLELQTDQTGRVTDSRVHDTVGPISRAMGQAALQASRQWSFRPERVAGVPQASTLLMPVCFTAPPVSEDCTWSGPEARSYGRDTVLALDPVARVTRSAKP